MTAPRPFTFLCFPPRPHNSTACRQLELPFFSKVMPSSTSPSRSLPSLLGTCHIPISCLISFTLYSSLTYNRVEFPEGSRARHARDSMFQSAASLLCRLPKAMYPRPELTQHRPARPAAFATAALLLPWRIFHATSLGIPSKLSVRPQ